MKGKTRRVPSILHVRGLNFSPVRKQGFSVFLHHTASLQQMSQLVGSKSGNFHLNYDQESPLLPIDRGGEDQALKSV